MMRALAIIAACAALAACGDRPASETAASPGADAAVESTAPAGVYRLDPAHASLVFRATHMGYSNYTALFEQFDARLVFDPENPEAMSVTAVIDPASIMLNRPPDGFFDMLMSAPWFNTRQFPEITFRSTSVEQTGPAAARVTGEMTFLGVTAPLSFDAAFNGGYPGMEVYDPQARIGFSAHGTLDRSDWGMVEGLPPEGSDLGAGDRVEFFIETEFTGPPLKPENQ